MMETCQNTTQDRILLFEEGRIAVSMSVLLLDRESDSLLSVADRDSSLGVARVRLESLPTGMLVLVELELNEPRDLSFVGLEFDLGELTETHCFFGTAPGFLEKQGVSPAAVAQQELRVASMMGMVLDPEGYSLLAGIGGPNQDASVFYLHEGRLRAGFAPERKLQGEFRCTLFVSAGREPLGLLQEYGRYLAKYARSSVSVTPTGWNSWDFYGAAISMADLSAEMTALGELGCRSQLSYLTVDMGWEEMWGDWTPNRKFPERLCDIAGGISAGAWRAGIWTAPLQVSMYSRLARNRQELFLRNAEGALVMDVNGPCGPVLLLDFSLSEVRHLVGGWYSRMREAGFKLFKIDYVYEEYLLQARYNAGGLGKVPFARKIFETIREAVGNQAHIINCGASKEAALGLVDSCRVTVDIHNFWGHIRNNARQLSHAFWMNRNCWVNDPDFAIVRHAGNCTANQMNMPYVCQPEASIEAAAPAEFWMKGAEASASEMRLWLSVVRLNGGSLFLADSIRHLTTEGCRDLERLFPPLEKGFIPLDLFSRDRPGVWLSTDSARPTLGIFNWEDQPVSMELPASLRGVTGRDFWSGQKMHFSDVVNLEARSGWMLEV